MKHIYTAGLFWLTARFAAAAPVSSQTSTKQATSEIQWGPCPSGSPTNLTCGQLQVPLDWNSPNGQQITLGITKVNATDPANRIGSVIFNPGGPGGVATRLCGYQASGITVFGQGLAERFDIVCPDPRGVGQSTPIRCDPDVWNQNISLFPSNEQEVQQLADVNKAKGNSCLEMSGDIVKHVDTTSAAKDIEAIRLGLNDGKLNWLGISYGSQLGGAYAELYPENIRAMAIDGILDHSEAASTTVYVESTTYENTLNQFFIWCAANATVCGFQGDDLPGMFDNLISSANESPIPASGCLANSSTASSGKCSPNATGYDILFNVQQQLLFKDPIFGVEGGWGRLGMAINQTIGGDATPLSNALATSNTSELFAATAISCLDWLSPNVSNITEAYAEFKQEQTMGSAFNPHVNVASQSYQIQATCAGWPFPIVNRPHLLNQTAMQMAPPILMVNADYDPSTSYVWALGLKGQIPTSVLLTREGYGHTSYFLHGEASNMIDTYLINGTLPQDGAIVQT